MNPNSTPNFKKLVKLSHIIGSEFYHQYESVTATKSSLHRAKTVHHSLPKNLKMIDLHYFTGTFSTWIKDLENIKELRFSQTCKLVNEQNTFPEKIKHITWNCGQKLVPGILPEGLTSLSVDYYQFVHLSIPESVKYLHIGPDFNHTKNRFGLSPVLELPTELRTLVLEDFVFPKELPRSLKKIVYGKKLQNFCLPNLDSKVKVVYQITQ